MNKVIFIGGIGKPNEFVGGELTKNKNILAALKSSGRDVVVVDIHGSRKHPFRLIKLPFVLLFNAKVPILVSTSLNNVYWLFVILSIFDSRRVVSFIGTGGVFPKKILKGKFKAKYLKFLRVILVQGKKMQEELAHAGLTNHTLLVNNKIISYLPKLDLCQHSDEKIRFVFVSRMHETKGVDMILRCCQKLNDRGLCQRYSMTFYGGFCGDEKRKNNILSIIDFIDNVEYKGVLNLSCNEGYDELSCYDVMLLPTFWVGEGFPGVAIDAMIAGLPMVVSDWNFNSEVVIQGKTGVVIPSKDENALLQQMIDVIDNPMKYANMRKDCQQLAMNYNTTQIVNESLFRLMGL